jgi:uncharacterized protein YchJ
MANCETGEILDSEAFKSLKNRLVNEGAMQELNQWKPMDVNPTHMQLSRKPPKVRRNDLCFCGSGKKFKKCCYLGKDKK